MQPDHTPLALLVDRDWDTRQMYAAFLKQRAFEVEEADDGREALAKAISHHPDVVVTETRLPGIDGFVLCRLLREDPSTHDIPLVVVTGDAFESDIKRARTSGADRVLTKPCLPEHLADQLREVLSLARHVRDLSKAARSNAAAEAVRAGELLERSQLIARRPILSRTHRRGDTTDPPLAPPDLRCPICDGPLKYMKSYVGGVSIKHQEQWDDFTCPNNCGSFQYRQRTRRVRRITQNES